MPILKKLGYYDPERQIQFCETTTEKLEQSPDLLKNNCFSDESGLLDYWGKGNPQIVLGLYLSENLIRFLFASLILLVQSYVCLNIYLKVDSSRANTLCGVNKD